MKRAIFAGLLLFIPASPVLANDVCSPSDFEVTTLKWQNLPEFETIHVTGSLVNNCVSPAYATVQLIYLNGAGTILDSSTELYPAGLTDIPPKSPRQFYWQQHFIGDVAKIEAKILRVGYSH